MELLDEAVRDGARASRACEVIGLSRRSVERWRKTPEIGDQRNGPRSAPSHKLTAEERAHLLEVANHPDFRDKSPRQIVPTLADRGQYIASESTFYRVLEEEGQLNHRERSRPATSRKPRQHVARAPNQVWCWDITYLRSSVRGAFYYLYLIVDIYSRKIVGWRVEREESMEHSAELLQHATRDERVDTRKLVLHADNGGPMRGSTMLATRPRCTSSASSRRSVGLASATTTPTRKRSSALSNTGQATRGSLSNHSRQLLSGSAASSIGTTTSTSTAPSATSRPTSVISDGTHKCSRPGTTSTCWRARAILRAGQATRATGPLLDPSCSTRRPTPPGLTSFRDNFLETARAALQRGWNVPRRRGSANRAT
jgi:transposase InsO family protein